MTASPLFAQRWRVSAALLAAALFLAGCADKSPTEQARKLAAKVNASEITVEQIDVAVANLPDIASDAWSTRQTLTRQVFDHLIDQQLAAEQAERKGLARSAEVVAAIESAQREILARAYFAHLSAEQLKPTPRDVHEYYGAHPELFAQRRIFRLQELTLAPRSDAATFARELVATSESIFRAASDLQSKGFKFNLDTSVRGAEELPLELLPKLTQASKGNNGGLVEFEAPTGIYLAQLISSQPAPRTEAEAAPSIEQFLRKQRAREAFDDAVKRLRASARIEYFGAFAGSAAAAGVPQSTSIALGPAKQIGATGKLGEANSVTSDAGLR